MLEDLPIELPFEPALEAILTEIARQFEAQATAREASMSVSPSPMIATVIVGVTGAVASGKSTFASKLAGRVESWFAPHSDSGLSEQPRRSAVILSTDHYLPDYDRTPEHLRDLPESSDLIRLAHDLSELRAGRRTRIPQWSFEMHARTGEVDVGPADVVIVEGLHALHHLPRLHVDWAIFVDAPREIRWSRAVERERAGDRPWPIEYLEHFFENVAEPTYQRSAANYRKQAHWIVRNG
ncbi:MAG: hypothetical protein RIR10_186 [Planctomycetota bacterium]